MADLPGCDPPDHGGGEQDQRHGVLAVPDAAAPRHQVRVRGLAGVGGHPGHRPQQGQLRGVQAAVQRDVRAVRAPAGRHTHRPRGAETETHLHHQRLGRGQEAESGG